MHRVKNEGGSVVVFVTIMIVVLLIMIGLGLDTGQLTYVRNQGQAAVDAAALAAVSGLPTRNPEQVAGRAEGFNLTNDYVESPTNKIGSGNISYVQYDFITNDITNYLASIATANGVRVALEQATGGSGITTPVFLTPLMNLFGTKTSGTKDVNVSAVAVITETPSIPIALWSNVCPAQDGITVARDVKIQMQHTSPQGGIDNACWTTFLDCSSGAADIKKGFTTASSCTGSTIAGQIAIDTPICQNRGEVATVLGEADSFFNAYLPPRWWLVPVIGVGGNCDPSNPTKITSWAKFKPSQVVKIGNPQYIKADVVCGPNIPSQELESSVCFSHRLVREKVKNM